jgi:hypothetical protein
MCWFSILFPWKGGDEVEGGQPRQVAASVSTFLKKRPHIPVRQPVLSWTLWINSVLCRMMHCIEADIENSLDKVQ